MDGKGEDGREGKGKEVKEWEQVNERKGKNGER